MNHQRVEVPVPPESAESAKGGITRRIAIRALPFAVAVALAFGVAASPEVASAMPVGGANQSCEYAGVTYSHGSIVKFDNGYYYICNNGTWEFHSSVPRPVINRGTANPGQVITASPIQNVSADPGLWSLEPGE
jgi:hypothetical protein